MKNKLVLITILMIISFVTGRWTASIAKVAKPIQTVQIQEPTPLPSKINEAFKSDKQLEEWDYQLPAGEKSLTGILTKDKSCGDCRTRTLYILDSGQIILKMELDDPTITELNNGFAIIEPVRKNGEPGCCPTKFKTRIFQWNGIKYVET